MKTAYFYLNPKKCSGCVFDLRYLSVRRSDGAFGVVSLPCRCPRWPRPYLWPWPWPLTPPGLQARPGSSGSCFCCAAESWEEHNKPLECNKTHVVTHRPQALGLDVFSSHDAATLCTFCMWWVEEKELSNCNFLSHLIKVFRMKKTPYELLDGQGFGCF